MRLNSHWTEPETERGYPDSRGYSGQHLMDLFMSQFLGQGTLLPKNSRRNAEVFHVFLPQRDETLPFEDGVEARFLINALLAEWIHIPSLSFVRGPKSLEHIIPVLAGSWG
jgi:hypothetical protein